VKIGIDIGGVIIDRAHNDGTDTSLFGDNYLNAKDVDWAIDSIGMLNQKHDAFKDNVWIVSKCGANIERKSREWLEHCGFHTKTGIPKERLHFCRDRRDKAPIAEKLGLTHFIDDKLEVLSYMKGIVKNRILFNPNPSEMARFIKTSGPVVLAFSWTDVMDWLRIEKT
jgi:hypothetical protein